MHICSACKSFCLSFATRVSVVTTQWLPLGWKWFVKKSYILQLSRFFSILKLSVFDRRYSFDAFKYDLSLLVLVLNVLIGASDGVAQKVCMKAFIWHLFLECSECRTYLLSSFSGGICPQQLPWIPEQQEALSAPAWLLCGAASYGATGDLQRGRRST